MRGRVGVLDFEGLSRCQNRQADLDPGVLRQRQGAFDCIGATWRCREAQAHAVFSPRNKRELKGGFDIIVKDGRNGLRGAQQGSGRIPQDEEKCLRGLLEVIADNADCDGLVGRAGRKNQRAGFRRKITARDGATIGGTEFDGHDLAARRRQVHFKEAIGDPLIAFHQDGPDDREQRNVIISDDANGLGDGERGIGRIAQGDEERLVRLDG